MDSTRLCKYGLAKSWRMPRRENSRKPATWRRETEDRPSFFPECLWTRSNFVAAFEATWGRYVYSPVDDELVLTIKVRRKQHVISARLRWTSFEIVNQQSHATTLPQPHLSWRREGEAVYDDFLRTVRVFIWMRDPRYFSCATPRRLHDIVANNTPLLLA